MLEAIVISDLHIGAENCQSNQLIQFLDGIENKCDRLIILGDHFDSLDGLRLRKKHWKILSILRKLSKKIPIIWCIGNHDEPNPEVIAHLLGMELVQEYFLKSGDKKIYFAHGHLFDDFIAKHKFLTLAGDAIYNLLQKVNPSHNWARLAKHSSKMFLRASEQVQLGMLKELEKNGCDVAIAGHTHMPKESGKYYNSGCWTENNTCTYLEINEGIIKLKIFDYEKNSEKLY